MNTPVDIICAVRNGAAFVGEFVHSVQQQTHVEWHLWVRDDGSTDNTPGIIAACADRDARIHLLNTGGAALGVAGAFSWLLERVPHRARYVFTADADDVWLPNKVGQSLAVMQEAEARASGPVLVHSDLTVVNGKLEMIDESFWHFASIKPEPVSLQRLLVQNVATSPTILINQPLRELVGSIPAGAVVHDWWLALVAAVFGRVIAMPQSTVLYRQHGSNDAGARRPTAELPWNELPGAMLTALQRSTRLRQSIAATAMQARAFLDRYQDTLTPADVQLLDDYARIPERGFLRRKYEIARLRLLREHGVLRNVGILLRA